MNFRIAVLACFFTLAAISNGKAQGGHDLSPQSSQQSLPGGGPMFQAADEHIMQVLSERKAGLVIMDARMPGGACAGTRIFVARKDDPSLGAVIDGSRSLFGTQIKFGGAQALLPGQYLVTRVNCTNYTTYVMIGPFAQFHVNAGEVVNAGVLILRPGIVARGEKGTISAAMVTDLGAEAYSRIKEKFPRVYARMIHRRMTLVSVAPARSAPAPGSAVSSPTIPGETRY